MASSPVRNALDDLLSEVQMDVDYEKDDEDAPERYTPALDKLNTDQHAWLNRWIKEGYDDRRELLLSVHQMVFWSFGRVPDSWYVHVCSRPVLLSILITSDRRHNYREDPIDLATAKKERRLLAAKFVRPAFRAAYRELRKNAQQYTDDGERVADVDEQTHIAMRPALDELYRKQTDLLLSLLNGFEDMAAVDEWLSRLDGGTLGELHKVEPDFDWKIHTRESAQRVLTGQERKYERERELWAATYLLPAYNRAVERWAEHADEHREDNQTKNIEQKGI